MYYFRNRNNLSKIRATTSGGWGPLFFVRGPFAAPSIVRITASALAVTKSPHRIVNAMRGMGVMLQSIPLFIFFFKILHEPELTSLNSKPDSSSSDFALLNTYLTNS